MDIILQTNVLWRAIKTIYTYTFRKTIMGCNLRYYEQFKVLWPIEEEHYFDNFCLILHFEFYCHNNWKRFSIFPTSFSFCCNSSRVTMEENRIILHYLKCSPRIDQNSKHVEKINSFCFFVSKYSPEFFTIDKLILSKKDYSINRFEINEHNLI